MTRVHEWVEYKTVCPSTAYALAGLPLATLHVHPTWGVKVFYDSAIVEVSE